MDCVTASPLALLVCILCIWSVVHIDAQNRVDEVQALTAFKNNQSRFIDNSGVNYWLTWDETDDNACGWVGVTCTPNFTVVELDLSNWYLPLLQSVQVLSRLPDLRVLDMSSSNMLSFPEDIGALTHLTRLDLSNNNFIGFIPQSISASRSLQYLSLENSVLAGPIPDLSALVRLQILRCADNYLSGEFPQGLGAISSLVLIDLSRNQLFGLIPSLVNSTNLVNLTLDNNLFSGFEESFYSPSLQYLSVAGNILEGSIPVGITRLQKVVTIDLSGNGLSGNIPADLTKLRNVSQIDLSRNQLSGNIPSGFSNIMSLHPISCQLDLYQNNLSGSIPLDFVQLQPSYSFFVINASFNSLNGSIPAVIGIGYINSTNVLDLSHNRLEGPLPSQLSGFAWLDLSYYLLSGNIVDVLNESEALKYAQYLFLGNNFLTGDLTKLTFHWANWSVEVVDLSNNNLSWRPTESIPDPVGAALANLGPAMLSFSVSGNDFSGTSLPLGPISTLNGNLSLSTLDLSDNQLEGVISDALFNKNSLPILVALNLSNNRITGAVPESIVVLSNTTVIDLSYNLLSGNIPFLTSNSTLINLQSIEGNPDLCGYPLPYCGYPFPQHQGSPQDRRQTGIRWWTLLLIVGGSVLIAVGSCLVATWRWRVYQKRHRQDADLIITLMERESVMLMPLRHLWKATDGFSETARIGEGGFGTVYRGILNDGTTVAIKKSKHAENDKRQFLNEVTILSQVNHRHLVKLLGCCMENKVALLVFEFVSNGTLQEHLRGRVGGGHLSWKQRLTIAIQTADALNYLHLAATSPIYHRDVKSANILLTQTLSAKVADFGISKLVPPEATHISTALQGTLGYMDPEYWISLQLTDKSDVFSFGVVLLELISAKPAVDFGRAGEESSLVFFAGPQIKSGDVQELIDPALEETYRDPDGRRRESILSVGRLAMKCLEMRSKARPSMNEVWKELHNLCLELNDTSPEDPGCMDEEENESSRRDDLALLSQNWSGENWTSDLHLEARSLELTSKPARVWTKFKSKSMHK